MVHLQRMISASIFRTWYELLEATVAQDPHEVAAGGSQPAVMLLHALVGIGLRNGAILPLVTHSTGPLGFAHLSFRYPVNREFKWGGEIELLPEASLEAARLEQLILELEAATGIATVDDALGHEPYSVSD